MNEKPRIKEKKEGRKKERTGKDQILKKSQNANDDFLLNQK